MEYVALILGVIVGVAVAFFCMIFYRRGIEDGRALTDKKPLESIIKNELKPTKKTEEVDMYAAFLGSNGDDKE